MNCYESDRLIEEFDLIVAEVSEMDLTRNKIYIAHSCYGDVVTVVNDRGILREYSTEYFRFYDGETIGLYEVMYMQREFFCGGCGLFHWVDQYKVDEETGRKVYVPHQKCPNEACISHQEEDIPMFAVDTTGFAYFSESHEAFINEVKWSSPKYAPDDAIAIYEKQGMRIER